ncbi:hypothetical protein JR316_0000229 [Psilocybe cubensis]|uniref:Amidohydrolase-related domain-containing protein n=2 Tax=Psilocybe cubensis TaxID=181762 RepID=A0A8H7Y9I6_PSICU|nr:hypothetical protein JR316_0000229 [Psilocybe cubensis]KAH9486165.1 hypothetical protein JR316_0000229 [Psilocybe cubensis]
MTSTRHIYDSKAESSSKYEEGDATGNGVSKTSRRVRRLYQIHVGQLFDSVGRVLVKDQVVTVDRDRGIIIDVSDEQLKDWEWVVGKEEVNVSVERIDLEGLVLLPGFVDVHVHLFLHPYSETSWDDQVTKESLSERTVRATVHARRTLLAGYTTVRDLGTEGALDADIGLRKCLAGQHPMIPGPRYYCATRAIVTTGSYGPKNTLTPSQQGVDGMRGAEPADGVAQCIQEVRKQIGAGADWIKIYADYRPRSLTAPVSFSTATRSIATFHEDEMKAMINTAHALGVKVAAHASTFGAIKNAVALGVNSIEHGGQICLGEEEDEEELENGTGVTELLEELVKPGGNTFFVPTVAVYYTIQQSGTVYGNQQWEMAKRTFEAALSVDSSQFDTSNATYLDGEKPDLNIACGGDTAVFPHGQNALEMSLMRKLGASWERVLGWGTYSGWKCVRGMEWEGVKGKKKLERLQAREKNRKFNLSGGDEKGGGKEDLDLDRGVPFGAIRVGWAADLIGIQGKLDGTPEDFEEAVMRGVQFVMKGGVIYKKDGKEVLQI